MLIVFEQGELEGNKYLGEGTHKVRISKVESKQSKTSGNPMLEIEFTSASGKTARDFFVVGQGANKFKLAGLAKAAGFEDAALKMGISETMLMGRTVNLTKTKTGERMYEGKKTNEYSLEYSPCDSGSQESEQADSNIPW